MIDIARSKTRRRPVHRFHPWPSEGPSNFALEPRLLTYASFFTDFVAPLGRLQARATSFVPLPFVLGGPGGGVVTQTTPDPVTANATSTFTGPTFAAFVPPNMMTPVGVTPVTETAIITSSVNGPNQVIGSNTQVIETVVTHMHADTVYADAARPYAFDFANGPRATTESRTITPYSWDVNGVAANTALTIAFSLELSPTTDRFRVTPTLVLNSTHLEVRLGLAAPGGNAGLLIWDPMTGTNYVNDPGFIVSGDGGAVGIEFTVPATTAEFLNYDSILATGPDGVFQNESAGQNSLFGWSYSLGLSN